MKRRIFAILLFLALAAAAKPALAQTANTTTALESGAWIGPVTLNWHETVGANTVNYSVSGVAAGPQIVTIAGAPPPGFASTAVVYCVDLYHFDGNVTPMTLEPFSATSNLTDFNAGFDGLTQAQFNQRLDQAAWLYGTYNPTVQGASGNAKEEDGAALQLAIWNIMAGANSGFTFLNGGGINSSIFSSVQTLSSSWYNSVGNNKGDGTLYQTNRQLDLKDGQDLLGPPPMAPESSSLALLAFALAGPLALLAIRKRRAASAEASAEIKNSP